MSRRPLVVGNWKMNGSVASANELSSSLARGAQSITDVDIVVCPSHLLLSAVANPLVSSNVRLGAQTLSEFDQGAYTGETSASTLVEVGCTYVIVGHSERRHLFGESSASVAEKSNAAVSAGLIPIICLGETQVERNQGITNRVIESQLAPFGPDAFRNVVIAYEPVWAIGTGETASPAQAQEVHAFIRSSLAKIDSTAAETTRILYGGSVKPDNAAELFAGDDVDGGLIGGASLKADDFLAICRAAL